MDTFKNFNSSLESPARCAATILPNDTVVLHRVTRALYVGEQGDLAVEMVEGTRVVFRNVPAGGLLPVRISRVLETDTTAGGIVGLW